jgi:glycosyltransferase involved in cell wall biosynthesis
VESEITNRQLKILFVVPYVPTLIRVRPYNFVRHVHALGHLVTLATVWENEQERDALAEFERLGIRIVTAPLTRNRKLLNVARAAFSMRPLQVDFCWLPELADKLDVLCAQQQFDAIHVEHLRGARYALHLKWQLANSNWQIPIVWDSVDSITHLFEQASQQSQSLKGKLMTGFELPRTRRYERMLATAFDRMLVTSPVDKAAFEKIANAQLPISVVPNGVDLTYFSSGNAPQEKDTLVFSGKMSYHANVTAALHLVNHIMPLVWASKPEVTLWIVGKDPTPEVQSCAARHPGKVIVTGMVPDMRDYLRKASIAVVPVVYGAGIQNKVLEAMACGTPVVTSDKTTASLQPGYQNALCVAQDADAFAQSVLRLLDDSDERARLSKAGRNYVETHHDWNRIAERLLGIYSNAERTTHDVQR